MPRSVYYPADQLKRRQVQRIEDIEEILHGKPPTAAGIEQEHRDRHQAPELLSAQIQPEDQQAKGQHGDVDRSAVQLRGPLPLRITAVLEQGREYRYHAAPEAVVDLQKRIDRIYRITAETNTNAHRAVLGPVTSFS